jgi:hypothetical protein
MADNIFVWIKGDTMLVNLSAIAYVRFEDEPEATVKSNAGIVFRTSNGQKEEIITLEPEEAKRLKDLLKQDLRLGLVKQR